MISAIKLSNDTKSNELPPVPVILREMGITVEQFSERLPKVDKGIIGTDDLNQGHYKLRSSNGPIEVVCGQKSNRNIGSLSIPILEVSIDLRRYDASKIKSFMKSFDHTFLKMGG